jgi:hypothetical protein
MKYMGFRCHDMGYKTSEHGGPAHSAKHFTMKRWPMHDCTTGAANAGFAGQNAEHEREKGMTAARCTRVKRPMDKGERRKGCGTSLERKTTICTRESTLL